MASTSFYRNEKNEIISMRIRAYAGMDETGKPNKFHQKSIKVPKGLSKRQLNSWVKQQEVLFEQECKSGFFSKNPKFRDFAKEFMVIKKNMGDEISTLNRYDDILQNRLLPYFGDMNLQDITPLTLNRFYEKMLETGQNKKTGGSLSPKTVRSYHQLLSSIFAEAKKQGILSKNPAESSSPPKVAKRLPNYYQEDEIILIAEALSQQTLKWHLMGLLFLHYGARRGEILGIKRQSLDFEHKQITFSSSVLYHSKSGTYEKEYPKNEKARVLPMSDDITLLLKKYLSWLDREKEKWGDQWIDTDYIFTGEHGGKMNPDSVTCFFKRLTNRCRTNNPDFPHLNPHAFRHTVVSHLLRQGLDIVTVAYYVGDDPYTIEKHYAHLIISGKKEAADIMSGLLHPASQECAMKAS